MGAQSQQHTSSEERDQTNVNPKQSILPRLLFLIAVSGIFTGAACTAFDLYDFWFWALCMAGFTMLVNEIGCRTSGDPVDYNPCYFTLVILVLGFISSQ